MSKSVDRVADRWMIAGQALHAGSRESTEQQVVRADGFRINGNVDDFMSHISLRRIQHLALNETRFDGGKNRESKSWHLLHRDINLRPAQTIR